MLSKLFHRYKSISVGGQKNTPNQDFLLIFSNRIPVFKVYHQFFPISKHKKKNFHLLLNNLYKLFIIAKFPLYNVFLYILLLLFLQDLQDRNFLIKFFCEVKLNYSLCHTILLHMLHVFFPI